jgi:hypothetical protein
MSGFTTAFPTSLKSELAQALHNFITTTGDVFKCALGVAIPVGTYNADTTNYSELVANGDEVPNGSGYSTGGFAFTAGQNITPQSAGGRGYWSWSANPQWLAATLSTSGCMIYNSSKSNRVVYVGGFAGVQSPVAQTLNLVMPVNAPTTAILRLT